MSAWLSCRGLVSAFGGVRVLNGIDLDVQLGEWVGVVGPNGAGKTVLLNAISGVNALQSGSVAINGWDVTRWSLAKRAARAGLIRSFENRCISARLSALQNVLLAAHHATRHEAEGWLERVGLHHVRDTLGEHLSLGEQRRVGLAAICLQRERVGNAAVVLLDEPFRGLDASARAELAALLRDHVRGRASVILVEHDIELTHRLSDRILYVAGGRLKPAGRINESGTPVRSVSAEESGVPAVTVTDLCAGYGETVVLGGLTFRCPNGSAVQLAGPNGSGKSTLLRVLTGAIVPWSGTVVVNGELVRAGENPRVHGIGYVPQGGRVIPGLSVQAHLNLISRYPAEVEQKFVAAVPEAGRLHGSASDLSAGQRALLTLRVALRGDPTVLLADEPAAGLAAGVRDRVYRYLLESWLRPGRAMLFVEHGLSPKGCHEIRLEVGHVPAPQSRSQGDSTIPYTGPGPWPPKWRQKALPKSKCHHSAG
jgi:ABC-type multidrug transport system ATPase subunit